MTNSKAIDARLETLTDERIELLRDNAGEAGDLEQVAICEAALAGDRAARRECARVVADFEAMDD